MNERKFLNEEKYQITEKFITLIAILVLAIGLCIGGFLIYRGAFKPSNKNVESLKIELQDKKSDFGYTPLEVAISMRNYDICKLFG